MYCRQCLLNTGKMLTDITGITQKQIKVGSGGIPQTGEMHQFRYNTKADQGR